MLKRVIYLRSRSDDVLETLKRIANALEGVHTELKRLNDTNPSNQAQAKPKQDKKKSFEPKNFI